MKLNSQMFFILLIFFNPLILWAENVVVIVNTAKLTEFSEADIKNIYLDNVVLWPNGSKIKSYNLPIANPGSEKFSQRVLGVTARNAAKAWANRKITNTAKNPPKTKKERLVLLYVKKNINAIGYVRESTIIGEAGVKVILTIQ